MVRIRCLFCSKPTTIHYISAQKKIRNKIITVQEAPVFYCEDCKETFLSKEAQEVFTFIRDKGLDSKSLIFNCQQVQRQFEIEDDDKEMAKAKETTSKGRQKPRSY